MFPVAPRIVRRTIVPDSKRIIVKLEASIAALPNAKRHKTEFAANAVKANPVRVIVLNKGLIIYT